MAWIAATAIVSGVSTNCGGSAGPGSGAAVAPAAAGVEPQPLVVAQVATPEPSTTATDRPAYRRRTDRGQPHAASDTFMGTLSKIFGSGSVEPVDTLDPSCPHSCKGKNECKGKGMCKVENAHDCKGLNACKGQGGCKPAC